MPRQDRSHPYSHVTGEINRDFCSTVPPQETKGALDPADDAGNAAHLAQPRHFCTASNEAAPRNPRSRHANPSPDPHSRTSSPHLHGHRGCIRRADATQDTKTLFISVAPSTCGAGGDGGGAARTVPPQLRRSCTAGYKNAAVLKGIFQLFLSLDKLVTAITKTGLPKGNSHLRKSTLLNLYFLNKIPKVIVSVYSANVPAENSKGHVRLICNWDSQE